MASNHPLYRYRKERGQTQEQLAHDLGVTGVTVSRWETGRRSVDRDLVPAISQKTKIPPRELRPDLAELIDDRSGEAA